MTLMAQILQVSSPVVPAPSVAHWLNAEESVSSAKSAAPSQKQGCGPTESVYIPYPSSLWLAPSLLEIPRLRRHGCRSFRSRLSIVGFGTTTRRDAWWAAPLAVFVGLSAFVVYATWAAFQGEHYTYGPYLSPFYSPELFGDSPHAWFGPKPAALAGLAAVLAGAAHPAVSRPLPLHLLLLPRRLLQGVLGRSAVVRRRRAAQELLRRALVSAHPAERRTASSCGSRSSSSRSSPTTCGSRSGSRTRPPARASSASASARSSSPSTSCCSPATPGAATSCATWSAAGSTRCRSRPSATWPTRACPASTGGTCCSPGAACSA